MRSLIYKNHVPIKKLGQNFLQNKEIINQIINLININKNDNIIEIGSGLGALTFPICRIIKKMIVLEIDEDLVFFLTQSLFIKKLQIIIADIIKFDFCCFFSLQKYKKYRFIGNLPYNIATIFFLKTIKFLYNIIDMHFMFQKEVAKRLLATPGTKEYGRLSIIAQYFYKIETVINVNKFNFFPTPKVDSTFLRFTPKYFNSKYKIDKHFSVLELITRFSFQHRRKFLNNNLISLFSTKELISLDIDPYSRAENVSLIQYCKLMKYYLKRKILCLD
ncbi:16S rRNA (adenine(1518)-N(6)/adenine(1519)-N(6))-dimethyltransferase RsmA [Buchnera aphidicola]|uniref:Ribosomal RNA small subunit methyltransferase A n=1 Tax=Buchnera aphidicola subsp. Cinara cedri (strain Cc) TaxID=372461 RepID=Q057Y3_BUCCC|nr:16S rRNA (adenine(1518)-N(6)/adenine(1519)-N(6))-dimethyltransferase RsmA [Buchnera aphidicola]ABJ90566.1 dimethyladenosine transferase [Buchnera aphidicola BCc]